MWSGNDVYIMVEAHSHLKLLPTSILDIYTVFKHIDMLRLAMLGFVSVGSTTQMIDIFVCCRHVANVGLTRRQHSVMSANILAVSVVSGNLLPTHFPI
jgi:hypothetical protein